VLLYAGVVERSKEAMATDFGLCGVFGVFSIPVWYSNKRRGGAKTIFFPW
jgi:hypothetical protein